MLDWTATLHPRDPCFARRIPSWAIIAADVKSAIRSTFVFALAAALLGLSALAQAQPFDRGERHWEGGGRRDGGQGQWQGRRDQGWHRQQPPQQGFRQAPQGYRQPPQQVYPQQSSPQRVYPAQPMPPGRVDRRGAPSPIQMPPRYAPGPPQSMPAAPQYIAPPGPPRWNHARGFRPGDALPPQYRQRQFIVQDWRSHRLYAPPPGYVWVQPEPGSYLLIGNNGVIANMLVGQ